MIRVLLNYLRSWFLLLRYYYKPRFVYERLLQEEGEDAGKNYILALKKEWGKEMMHTLNLHLHCQDESGVQEGEKVVYICNHQGLIDIPVLYTCLPENIAFVAKKELFSLPFIGYWIKKTGCVAIDRSSPRKGMQSIKDAADALEKGMNMVIFPEGTRTKAPDGAVAPFKQGSLKLAFFGKAQVVPVMIEGTRHIFSRSYAEKEVDIYVHIGKKSDPQTMTKAEQKQLAETIQQWIEKEREHILENRTEHLKLKEE